MSTIADSTDSSDGCEASPLLSNHSSPLLSNPGWSVGAVKSIIILLTMKICGNMFENQFATYDVNAFKLNNISNTCEYAKKSPSSMLTIVVIAMATAAFLLPTLGGLLSDAFIGSLRVLWLATGIQLCGSIALVTLDGIHVTCHKTPYLLSWSPVLLYMGFGDTILLYAPMQLTHDRRNRQLVLLLYFVSAAAGETIGNMPALLRYLTGRSFEFLGILFSLANLACMTMLSRSGQVSLVFVRGDFRVPRLPRLRKFYRIAAGAIPHLTCITLCRITLFWQQVRHFTHAQGDYDVVASNVGLVGYQTATILLSSCAAVAVFRGCMPEWITLRSRIRAGLCLMILTKVVLLLVSLLDYVGVMQLEGSSFMAVCGIYFVFAFCDGVTNVLTTLAIYELIFCIAEKSAKATFMGVFYTVWGLAILMNGAILLILQACGVLSLDLADVQEKPKSHYAYGAVILLLLIAVAYWEKIAWPSAAGLLADHEAEENNEREDS